MQHLCWLVLAACITPLHALALTAAGGQRLALRPSSRSPALAMGAVRQVTTEEFEAELQDCATPILLDVFAVWCGPCQLMAPEMDKVAEHYGALFHRALVVRRRFGLVAGRAGLRDVRLASAGDRCRVLKIDADDEAEVADTLQVRGLPTVLLINDMSVVMRAEGALMADELKEIVDFHFFGARMYRPVTKNPPPSLTHLAARRAEAESARVGAVRQPPPADPTCTWARVRRGDSNAGPLPRGRRDTRLAPDAEISDVRLPFFSRGPTTRGAGRSSPAGRKIMYGIRARQRHCTLLLRTVSIAALGGWFVATQPHNTVSARTRRTCGPRRGRGVEACSPHQPPACSEERTAVCGVFPRRPRSLLPSPRELDECVGEPQHESAHVLVRVVERDRRRADDVWLSCVDDDAAREQGGL